MIQTSIEQKVAFVSLLGRSSRTSARLDRVARVIDFCNRNALQRILEYVSEHPMAYKKGAVRHATVAGVVSSSDPA